MMNCVEWRRKRQSGFVRDKVEMALNAYFMGFRGWLLHLAGLLS